MSDERRQEEKESDDVLTLPVGWRPGGKSGTLTGKSPDAPHCPFCGGRLDYTGWIGSEHNSTWHCEPCQTKVEVSPFVPSKERQAVVSDLSQVDSAQRVVTDVEALRAALEQLIATWRQRIATFDRRAKANGATQWGETLSAISDESERMLGELESVLHHDPPVETT